MTCKEGFGSGVLITCCDPPFVECGEAPLGVLERTEADISYMRAMIWKFEDRTTTNNTVGYSGDIGHSYKGTGVWI